MFVNLETCDFKDAMRISGTEQWSAIAAGILQTTDWNVAIGKIAEVLQHYASKQPVPAEPLHASLFALALARIDFFTLALELALNAEASDPSLIKCRANETDEFDREQLAA